MIGRFEYWYESSKKRTGLMVSNAQSSELKKELSSKRSTFALLPDHLALTSDISRVFRWETVGA